MGNRFATVEQYHQLVIGHGILAVITFLFLVPIAIIYARFRPFGSSVRLHAYLQVLAVGLTTVVFILGWFAVGPNRSLTNPHHGIGVAIYTMILVQIVGGRLVKNIRRRSFRLMLHRWLGRAVAILGIIQIPLGLTLYGSPLYTFILFAVWMAILFVTYFFLAWRHEAERHPDDVTNYGGRSESGVTTSEGKSRRGMGWLGPLAAGAGILALLRGRRDEPTDQTKSRSSLPSSRARPPEVIPSQGGSDSYADEKISGRTNRREGGIMNSLLGILGLLGAGGLVKGVKDRRERRRHDDEEYSAVPTDTPNRPNRFRKPATDQYTESDFSDDRTDLHAGPRLHTPLLPGPRNPAATTVLSGTDTEPMTPRPLHSRPTNTHAESSYISDYSSYVDPARRQREEEEENKDEKGILGLLGLGWLAKRMKGQGDNKREEDERRRMEDARRDGRRGSKYTGDGYSTPTRSTRSRPPAASAPTATSFTVDSGSSMLESRPPGTSTLGPPMPPLGAGSRPPPVSVSLPSSQSRSRHSRSRSRSRAKSDAVTDPVSMPSMPPDPHGLLRPLRPESVSVSDSFASTQSGTQSGMQSGMQRRPSAHRRREGEEAAAAAAASAAGLAAEEDRRRDTSQVSGQPVSVKVRYHDDRDRKITLRRLTEEETAAAARRHSRGRSDSVSSLSESEAPTARRHYRRDSSSHKTADETAAEGLVSQSLSPPSPAFTKGRRAGKDSAYYSGQPGPSARVPYPDPTVSSIVTESQNEWSALSPSPSGPTVGPVESSIQSAADRRRRRRQERRDQRPTNTVEFS